MKAAPAQRVSLTPWHLRERASHLRHDLAKTVQSNFFYSFLFLPKAKRDAIIDVYRFCRAVDDIVDDIAERGGTIEEARAGLDEWRGELNALYAGQPTKPIARRLQHVLAQFPMPQEYFEEMINGCEMDLHQHRYETFEELYQYCYRVASITGLMCIEIFTYTAPQTKEYAVNLGLALQLTNILRDVKEDAARGRVYLPQEDCRRFGYTSDDWQAKRVTPACLELMRFEVQRTREFFARGQALLPLLPAAVRVDIDLFGRGGLAILTEVERQDYDVWTRRPEVSKRQKAGLLLRALGGHLWATFARR